MTEPVSHPEVGESSIGAREEVGEITGGVQAEVGVVTEVGVDHEGVVEVVNGTRVEGPSLRKMILVIMVTKMVILTWNLAQRDLKDSKCWQFLFQVYRYERHHSTLCRPGVSLEQGFQNKPTAAGAPVGERRFTTTGYFPRPGLFV